MKTCFFCLDDSQLLPVTRLPEYQSRVTVEEVPSPMLPRCSLIIPTPPPVIVMSR